MRDQCRTPWAGRAAAVNHHLAFRGLLAAAVTAVTAVACNMTDPTGMQPNDGQREDRRTCPAVYFPDTFKALGITANISKPSCFFGTDYFAGSPREVDFGAVVRVPGSSIDSSSISNPSFDFEIDDSYTTRGLGFVGGQVLQYDPNNDSYYRDDVVLQTYPARYHATSGDTTFLRDSATFTIYNTREGTLKGSKVILGLLDKNATHLSSPVFAYNGVTTRFTAVPGLPTPNYTYSWTLDGQPVDGMGPILDVTFSDPGNVHSVVVTATRWADGVSTSATASVLVQDTNPCPDNQISC